MAESRRSSKPEEPKREDGVAPPVHAATDGGDSRLTKGYEENADKPDPSSIAQVEVLVEE